MKLKIALLQLMPGKGPEEQYGKGTEACIRAKEMGADIAALFPEMWSDGYFFPQTPGVPEKLAIGLWERYGQKDQYFKI